MPEYAIKLEFENGETRETSVIAANPERAALFAETNTAAYLNCAVRVVETKLMTDTRVFDADRTPQPWDEFKPRAAGRRMAGGY